MECIQELRSFGGTQKVFRHSSTSTQCDMEFAVFDPHPDIVASKPALFYLSGLTCTWANVAEKAGAQRFAAEHGMLLVMPDTSPRGLQLAGKTTITILALARAFISTQPKHPGVTTTGCSTM